MVKCEQSLVRSLLLTIGACVFLTLPGCYQFDSWRIGKNFQKGGQVVRSWKNLAINNAERQKIVKRYTGATTNPVYFLVEGPPVRAFVGTVGEISKIKFAALSRTRSGKYDATLERGTAKFAMVATYEEGDDYGEIVIFNVGVKPHRIALNSAPKAMANISQGVAVLTASELLIFDESGDLLKKVSLSEIVDLYPNSMAFSRDERTVRLGMRGCVAEVNLESQKIKFVLPVFDAGTSD